MCAIFGLLDYGGKLTAAERLRIIRAVGRAAEVRGTDASGIAYVHNGRIQIQKAPRPAHKMKYRIAPSARYIMGHTRMATQGAASHNYNNHPFPGKAGTMPFALAHNGVLFNDWHLRKSYKLPRTVIETDSYVAVQLIEQQGALSAKSLKQMAEALDGTFTITVLDGESNFYFVKGNNPLTIYRFPSLGFYLYASTEEILTAALQVLDLSEKRKELISVHQGDILKIDRKGNRTASRFNDSNLRTQEFFHYGGLQDWHESTCKKPDPYLDDVVNYGLRHGVPEAEIRLLINAGYDALDLEELLYDPVLREHCVYEIIRDNGIC